MASSARIADILPSSKKQVCFAGKREDEGWLLSICYDASLHTSEFIILNAQTMTLQAQLPLKHVLPHGLHGGWSSTCNLSEDCL